MAYEYPYPWKIHPTGPNEWCVKCANNRVLFYLSADDLDMKVEMDDPDYPGYGKGNHIDVFSAESLDGDDDSETPLLDQLQRMFEKGPK